MFEYMGMNVRNFCEIIMEYYILFLYMNELVVIICFIFFYFFVDVDECNFVDICENDGIC